LERVSRDGLG